MLTADASTFKISFSNPSRGTAVSVVLYTGGFVTHSLHMGARMAVLDSEGFVPSQEAQSINVVMPPSANIAVPGPYMVFVLVDGTPSVGSWVSVQAPRPTQFSLDIGNETNAVNVSAPPPKSAATKQNQGGPEQSLALVLAVVVLANLAF